MVKGGAFVRYSIEVVSSPRFAAANQSRIIFFTNTRNSWGTKALYIRYLSPLRHTEEPAMVVRPDFFGRPLRGSEIGIRGDIAKKWSKLTTQEITGLKSIDALVTLVQNYYQLPRHAAVHEVEAFTKGRRF